MSVAVTAVRAIAVQRHQQPENPHQTEACDGFGRQPTSSGDVGKWADLAYEQHTGALLSGSKMRNHAGRCTSSR